MTTDSVTLQQAMADAGTGDVGLLAHAIARAAPGIMPFGLDLPSDLADASPALPADVWDKVKADVKQHVQWHNDPRFTEHALPGGKERITRGPLLTDPVVYEG